MGKLAVVLAIVIGSALLHNGAMVGFDSLMRLSSSHAAHESPDVPNMPFCPAGYICPFMQAPSFGFAQTVLAVAFAALVVFARLAPRVLLPCRTAPFDPFPPPNNPKILLSVFKRE